jgi:benzoate membrane transport protein
MAESKFADLKAPLLAGTVASVTGTAASAGLVLAALTALNASAAQTATAIFVLLLLYGGLSIVLSYRYKMPISIVWSTPGAAMLIGAGALHLKFAEAAGAFIVAAILLALTGVWSALGRLVSAIPKPIASAMLAGVIFKFCIAPYVAAAQDGGKYAIVIIPGLIVWLVLYRFATIWAAPAAMVVIFGISATQFDYASAPTQLLPELAFVAPEFSLTAIVSIAIPLYLVTMASQNLPGVAIMKSFGYEVPFRPVMLSTGLGAVVAGFFGGFSLNLAAITAALNANDHAHKNPARRWLASVFGGVVYVAMAFVTGAVVTFVLGTPNEIVLATAGLALVGTIVNSVSAAVESTELRVPAVVTFLVGASGIVVAGIGSAFWALLAGLVVWLWLGWKKKEA